jgi:hypothetical protein
MGGEATGQDQQASAVQSRKSGRRTGGAEHVSQLYTDEDLVTVKRIVVQHAGIVIYMPQLLRVPLEHSEQVDKACG